MQIRQFQAQRMQAPRDFTPIENTPICVEIGAGKGKHALLFSGQNPQHTLYAIERTREKFLAMQKQHGLEPQRQLGACTCRCFTLGCTCSISCSSRTFLYPLSEPRTS